MKLFIRNILILSVIILGAFATAEYYVRSIPNPARFKHQWMLKHSDEVETLILGSSHCFYGINPHLLGPHTFSLAQPTQTYRYDYYQLTHYDMPKLRTVIIPFSYQSLFEDLEAEPRLRYWAVRYRLYMDCNIHSRFSPYAFECMHIASFREKLSSLWRQARLKWDSTGFGKTYGDTSLLTQGQDNGANRAAENTYKSMHSLSFCTSMLDSIAYYCDKRKIKLILVTSPTSPSFRNHCLKRQIEVNDSTLMCIRKRHPSISYHNFWADSSFKPSDFYDADHLNLLGAQKLTLKLINELK